MGNKKDSLMAVAIAGLNADIADDLYIPVRISEYRALVETATRYGVLYEEEHSKYLTAWCELDRLKNPAQEGET